jgi:hypothetical protein
MKANEALTIVKKYGFAEFKDYKKVIAMRDNELPKINNLLTEVENYLNVSEPKLKEIEEGI